MDEILHEAEYKQSKERFAKLDKFRKRDYSNDDAYQQLLKDYVELSSQAGASKLAEYVAHRKTIIDLLEKYLEWCNNNEDYEQEQVLHNLIYTMGGSQDTIRYDKHNLWLLDDRLAFHRYIYSDKQIRLQEPVKGVADSPKETDLAIYDTSFLYGEKDDVEEVKSVVIFELKRPNRSVSWTEFTKQMHEQIGGVIKGQTKDYKGKRIQFQAHTPITFYFVCDVNAFEELKDSALMEGFNVTPYNSLLRLVNDCHQEILTYQMLIRNAKRKNAIFFKKLGI